MAPDEQPSAVFKEAMAAMLDHLWELARGEELDTPFCRFKAKVAPIEFVYISALRPLASHPTLPDSYPPSPHPHSASASAQAIALHNASWLHAHRAVPYHVLPSYKLNNSYMPTMLSIRAGTSVTGLG
jgi:hypothetical protein